MSIKNDLSITVTVPAIADFIAFGLERVGLSVEGTSSVRLKA